MEWKDRASVVSALTDSIYRSAGWCDDVSLQGAVFFFQALSKTSSEYEFTLDRTGPFSSELADDLALFRSRDILRLEPQPAPFGPSYVVTDIGMSFRDLARAAHSDDIDLIGTTLGRLGPLGRERFFAAMFVTLSTEPQTLDERIQKLLSFRPKASRAVMQSAFEVVDEVMSKRAVS